ncbi:carbohydrate esterase family 9 protein [Grosmannia clavigera kw1407]|uniref:Carbohydrate esterase family 9 protein n=1 Tax=Grosmannia clavigera (strain kw1407 / UAMH 11150) TaxID=655863 RepID=F0XCK5_GROCL|nr:carbohydrate esterase family 9 protein [Grosmannia clavigera kw1407]EFX03717.1 carbohydrate esterase family 9 protein [Grosmannia clavigera kw1407]
MEKGEQLLPPYSATVPPPPPPQWTRRHGPRSFHSLRRRGRFLRLAGLACLLYIGYAQWTQLKRGSPVDDGPTAGLSLEKLQEDVATCAALHSIPSDAEGLGRATNARYLDGQRPVLIRNATVWVGEPVAGTTAEEARAGKGFQWITADVLLENGLIQQVAPAIGQDALPASTVVWDARGRQLTAGIIDMHSHAGLDSLPELDGNEDTNEISSDITPYVRAIDGIQPQDHQIQVTKSGGVTTSLVLPGSGNNIGGEAYVIKHAVDRHDGRPELSIASLLAAPDAPGLRYIKMACGENAKRVYGKVGERGPYSRLGESWEFRHAFEQAAALVQAQDDWCSTAEAAAAQSNATLHHTVSAYLPRDLKWDTLAAVLRGQVRVNTHCYTVPDLEAFVDHTNEFRFPVWAFHHAHQTFLVPEILKRAWGADRFGPPASAMFADNMYYKAESYVASEFAGKILYDNGLTPIYVSDNPVLNAQHVLFEAAKAYHYGLPYHAALASVTTAPAARLGLGQRLGRVKPGFDADIVVWDSDPLSVGATPVQVWIDGVVQFEDPVELSKPASQPVVPDEKLALKSQEAPVDVGGDVVFTGVAKVLLPGFEEEVTQESTAGLNVAVSGGRVTCVGACSEELRMAREGSRVVSLQNGYVTAAFTAFASKLGLLQIDAEKTTDNGASGGVFSRAIDGLALGGKKLDAAQRYGVTRAISAPEQGGAFTHFGTSAGFLTGGGPTTLDDGVVFASDAAVHYTLGQAGKTQAGGTPSLSSAVGALRNKLLKAVAASSSSSSSSSATEPFSEAAYLQQVVAGSLSLAVTTHSADSIAAILRVKKEVEAAAAAASAPAKIRLVIVGGAESFLLADQLAAADVGVVLAPLQSYRTGWDERRALTGAPLTNGTAIDVLVDAGVVVAIGLEEDWLVRDLALLAGIAYKNGGGRLTEKTALDLISTNIYKMLQLGGKQQSGDDSNHFVVYEGSPLEIGSKIRAVAGGLGKTTVFE